MVLRNQDLDIEHAHCYQSVINSMSSLWVELYTHIYIIYGPPRWC